jgi:acyl dehydratase
MASPTIIPSISAIKDYLGVPLGPGDWVTVTQQQIDAFATATGDRQWIHIDVERAKRESPFQRTIAHGYLTMSLASAMLPSLVRVEKVGSIVNYGIDKMRLPAPVPAGGRLRLSAEINDVREMPNGAARVRIGLHFEIEGGAKPACTANAVFVYLPEGTA